ncbi:hypothetical protein [Parapedobacter indicus]|uniref:Uncharacterized protein n=1 Tax=Parapedobacter indicus TaxID=1477437 RepID=A0A1I3SPC6_9SPHI|nr:hypothetical protein [Parapedobacter indicus]PPK99733.1 hypothetical protein CLV26_11166 [Parapedobacter indicus]SFJ60694.1 hypothetical protein SAMN05444682_111133 [Parapedobacter indicus]
MKGLGTLIALQALLSTISGILVSQMSFVGKVGIRVLYSEYGIFRIWWKTAVLLFALQLILIFVLWLVKRLLGQRLALATILLMLLFGLIGAYFTYLDFTTTSHRLMKESFHSGGYLFWGSWSLSCLYFMIAPRSKKRVAEVTTEPPAEPSVSASAPTDTM